MRLIDADELMKDRVNNDPVRIAAKCEPTAYDIDKVVEQLENASCYIEDGNGHAGHLVFTDEAIKIVKGGAE